MAIVGLACHKFYRTSENIRKKKEADMEEAKRMREMRERGDFDFLNANIFDEDREDQDEDEEERIPNGQVVRDDDGAIVHDLLGEDGDRDDQVAVEVEDGQVAGEVGDGQVVGKDRDGHVVEEDGGGNVQVLGAGGEENKNNVGV